MTEPSESSHAAPRYQSDEANFFHEGIALFNEGEWFEAHEVWEDIWHMASGAKKLFYQGLIQCAVTMEHVRRGNPRGVRSVYESAQTKFRGLPETYMGINIPQLLRVMSQIVTPILELPAEAFRPGVPHGQELPVHPSKLPHIDLAYDPFETDKTA